MLITAYFEYTSPDDANQALSIISRDRPYNSSFSLVADWRTNGKPGVIEIDFSNPAGTNPHPFDFPYRGDVAGIASATRATRVTSNNKEIWPNQIA